MIKFVGLDGEMTGSRLRRGDKLCQIGVAFDIEESYVTDIGWPEETYQWQDQALRVNGFTHERIQQGRPAQKIDLELSSILIKKNIKKGRLVPVGFAVGTFDMPFIRDALPKTTYFISPRTVDLNAVCFTLGETGIKYGGSTPKAKGWKKLAKKYAEGQLMRAGIYPTWHNAGYDAAAALLSWRFLIDRIKENNK